MDYTQFCRLKVQDRVRLCLWKKLFSASKVVERKNAMSLHGRETEQANFLKSFYKAPVL
jgi:hypothetical protein